MVRAAEIIFSPKWRNIDPDALAKVMGNLGSMVEDSDMVLYSKPWLRSSSLGSSVEVQFRGATEASVNE